RSVWPYTYSSATRSPTTAMRAPSKRDRSERRSALRCMEAVSLTKSSGAASSRHRLRQRLRRARLPAAVHPEPVIGMGAHLAFDGSGQLLGERPHGGMATGARRRREGTLDLDPVRAVRGPHRENGEELGSGAQGEDGGGRRRAGELAEEVDEDSPRSSHVLVDDQPQGLPPPEQLQRRLRRSLVG